MSTMEISTVVVTLVGVVLRFLLDYTLRRDRRTRRRLRVALAAARRENALLKAKLATHTPEHDADGYLGGARQP